MSRYVSEILALRQSGRGISGLAFGTGKAGEVGGSRSMKQVWKLAGLIGSLASVWVACLLSRDLPPSLARLVPYLPVYAVIALGCYGLGAVGYGLMVFPTCPLEAALLQKDIDEARAFYKDKGFDVGLQ